MIKIITEYKCDTCSLASICCGKAKLKPFTEEAKIDLGIMLRMVECANYTEEKDIEPQEGILVEEQIEE